MAAEVTVTEVAPTTSKDSDLDGKNDGSNKPTKTNKRPSQHLSEKRTKFSTPVAAPAARSHVQQSTVSTITHASQGRDDTGRCALSQHRTTNPGVVTLLHISDTHTLHRTLLPEHLPDADILVHTGDFTNSGTDLEFADFNDWLGSLRPRYKHILVICGNHEFRTQPLPDDVLSRDFAKTRLPHATHVLHHETVEIEGLIFFGSPWCPWVDLDPDSVSLKEAHVDAFRRWSQLPEALDSSGAARVNRFDEIPKHRDRRVDVLLTHCPPFGVFDKMAKPSQSWGSSRQLRQLIDIGDLCLGAHLFGHLHEQRGYWEKKSGPLAAADCAWSGGCEYEAQPGVKFPTCAPPSMEYACELISCNPMKNHRHLDGLQPCIVAPGRLIYAKLDASSAETKYTFSVSL